MVAVDRMMWKKGYVMENHTHEGEEHVMLLLRGRLRVRIDGAPAEYRAPAMIWLPVRLAHGYDVLEDAVVVNLRYDALEKDGKVEGG